MRFLLFSTYILFLFLSPIIGQSAPQLTANIQGNLKFFAYDASNIGRYTGTEGKLNPSIIKPFKAYNAKSAQPIFAFGLRTSLAMRTSEGVFWKQNNYEIGTFPLFRFYLPSATLFELSGGPIFRVGRSATKQPGYWTIPYYKYILWQVSLGIGQQVKITENVFFEPIISYEIVKAGLLKISNDNNFYGEEERGIKIYLGFQFIIK